jgi:hypothetical protein
MSSEDLSNDYSSKFASMIMRIPNTMYIFEVTKNCGYSEFVLVYKDFSIADLIKTVSIQFQDSTINSLCYKNPETDERRTISSTDSGTIREMITQFQNDETINLKPVYQNMEFFVVYRLYILDEDVLDQSNKQSN